MKTRSTQTITLAATVAATLALSSCKSNTQTARYNNYQDCVQEFTASYCQTNSSTTYVSFRRSGSNVFAYNPLTRNYQQVPFTASIYQNAGRTPVRASQVQRGGFGGRSGWSFGG